MAGNGKLLDSSRIQITLGDYGTCRATALSDAGLHLRTQEFRRHMGGRMMALDKKGMKQKMPACDYLVSRKIDGEFTVLVIEGNSACTINPGGTVRIGMPFVSEACSLLSKAG